jgi:diphosphomevalonate decarboxylase
MTEPIFSIFSGPGKNSPVTGENFSTCWQSPSNIALVKYWGKKDGQVPLNPSLSMTLEKSVTQTRVHVSFGEAVKGMISVNGIPDHPFIPKMQHLFQKLEAATPQIGSLSLRVETSNSFPHSTGIASSASGMSALALCLLEIACKLEGVEFAGTDWHKMASFAARLGSGSACRSLYGGFAEWGETSLVPGSSDDYAVNVNGLADPRCLSFRDAILIISSRPKELPSSMGHRLMNDHPFLGGRITQANLHLAEVLEALSSFDIGKLAACAENEALSLHALIMSARPGVLLMQAGTMSVIHKVREARKRGLPVFFTLDAGANVHVLYPGDAAIAVEHFIDDELSPFCENGRVILDNCGPGPSRLPGNPEMLPG